MEENNVVLDIIITFIKACQKKNDVIEPNEQSSFRIWKCRYLLGQILRNYQINDRYLITVAAKQTWEKITSKPIDHYHYREIVECDIDSDVILDRYIGNSSKKNGEIHTKEHPRFVYRDVFHEEHIIPLNMIIDELCELSEVTYETVIPILNKICICRMLKNEDRKIIEKKKRNYNSAKEIIEEVYRKYDIEIYNWDIEKTKYV